MEYTVQKLGRLAGISPRTLRYYDEIGLLKPGRTNSSGYRIYGQAEVDRLQHILFYRELGMSLEEIQRIVASPSFNESMALQEHRERLLAKRRQLDLLIANVDNTIAMREGRGTMNDREKFEGFKRQLIADNERKYGEELRRTYGEKTVASSNAKLMSMTAEEYEEAARLADEVKAALAGALRTGDPASAEARRAVELHKRWLTFYWSEYKAEAHAGLAQMYVDDERFKAYYDENQPGTAEFLRDAIFLYTGLKNEI